MKPLKTLKETVTPLPRGGYLVQSPIGYIQFGSPPETIKDTMALPESVPLIFVLPQKLFNWQMGINLSDLEFPIYYNTFLRKKKTLIVCQKSQAGRLIRALQEALFGPQELFLEGDVLEAEAAALVPDLRRELDYFRGSLRFHDILTLGLFRKGRYTRENVTIVQEENGDFELRFDGRRAAHVPGRIEYKQKYDIGQRLPEPYRPPLFGVTCLGTSHGFDPKENTSGFIIWLNHNGIMIDPPVNSTEWLEDSNVNPKLIDSIILTHCHADHDAGTLQKILEERKITVFSTKTVMQSFLRKYSSLTGEPVEYLCRLFDFRPITIGSPVFIHGGEFRFHYMLHSIPTIGFTLKFQDQSFVYSSDHQADPSIQKQLLEKRVIRQKRYRQLQNFPWNSKVIYHESGIPPLHTPISFLESLPRRIQKKIVVYHIAKKDFPRESNLSLAKFGIENTLYFKTRPPVYEKVYQTLGALKHLDFFASLPVEKAQEFVTIIEERSYAKADVILQKGQPGNNFYIICSGNVSVKDDELLGRKILGTYEYFGEVALLTEKMRTADVVAETDVTVLTIAKDKFLSFIRGTEFEKTLQRLIKNRSSETWNILSSSPFSRQLTTYQKTWLESILVPIELIGPDTLIQEGKPLERIYLLRRGEAEVSMDGRRVAVLKPGDLAGSTHAIQRGLASEYTVSYRKRIALFALRKDDLLEFIQRNPGLGMKLANEF